MSGTQWWNRELYSSWFPWVLRMSSSWMWTGGTLLGQVLILYPSSLHWIWEGPQGMWISEAWGLPFQRPQWWFGLCRLSLVFPSPHNVCKSFLQSLVSHCLASSKVFPLLPSHYFLICTHLMVISWNKTKQQHPNLVFCHSRFAVIAMECPQFIFSSTPLSVAALPFCQDCSLTLSSSLLHSVGVQCPTHRSVLVL